MGRYAVALAAVAMLGMAVPHTRATFAPEGRLTRLPPVMLWAWERPEDLSFIDPHTTGVAYLARTFYLEGDRVLIRPRLQPLIVPPGAVVIPVVRIETDRDSPPILSMAQRAQAVSAIAEMARSSPIEIQIDFDATRSQRGFYRALLSDLRARLPGSIGLSITALASWCIYDDWIRDLPVDEAVPMLFSMGADSEEIAAYIRRGGTFAPAISRRSIGIGVDDPIAISPAGRRVYVFSSRAWTRARVEEAIAEAAR